MILMQDEESIYKLSAQLEQQKKVAIQQGSYSLHEIEMYFRLEYHLFDSPFASKFQPPKTDIAKVNSCINENILFIMKNIFNPILETSKTTFSNANNRMNPDFNKYFTEFSSEKINPFICPVETIFMVLSKMHWNSKLKLAKAQKIALTCMDLSKEQSISFFDTDHDLKDLERQQTKRNVDSLTELFQEFFQLMASYGT